MTVTNWNIRAHELEYFHDDGDHADVIPMLEAMIAWLRSSRAYVATIHINTGYGDDESMYIAGTVEHSGALSSTGIAESEHARIEKLKEILADITPDPVRTFASNFASEAIADTESDGAYVPREDDDPEGYDGEGEEVPVSCDMCRNAAFTQEGTVLCRFFDEVIYDLDWAKDCAAWDPIPTGPVELIGS